jgi:hypothetical protein
MMYAVSRLNSNKDGVVVTFHPGLEDAVDTAMWLHSRGIEGININAVPDSVCPAERDEE